MMISPRHIISLRCAISLRRAAAGTVFLSLLAGGAFSLRGAETPVADAEGLEYFEAKIRPVLVRHCYSCHSASAKKSEGNLFLDSRAGLLAGGDRGPAVVPGKPEESLLLTAIEHAESDLKMPPKKEQLPRQVAADFRRWIERGAPDPREQNAQPGVGPVDLAAGRRFWSYQPARPQAAPAVSTPDWPRAKLDFFLLAELEKAGLGPADDAPPATLLRRLHFDLTGLPPSPERVKTFQAEVNRRGLEAALEGEVDRLLASPRFGEHWGRHWLDVARYAESSGKEANMTFPYAWRYRDYVIDAMNADLPFDRFLLEQVAGDLLPHDDDAERARLLIATGFLALGPKNLDEAEPLQFTADLIDEQIDTLTRAVLASSVACARCHDHKFEPFSMRDYYALAGIFASTKTYFGTYVTPVNRVGGDPLPLPPGAKAPILHQGTTPERVAKWKEELAALKQRQEEGMAAVMRALAKGEETEEVFSLTEALRIFWTSGNIEGQLEKVDDRGNPLPLAMGVLDAEQIGDAPLLARGEVKKPGELVPRRLPEVFAHSEKYAVPPGRSGRLELARWLADPEHPLTARVMVNRVWRHLFGAGLVSTVDNFGMSGARPSHPELLDDLAVQFTAEGWSVKRLVRNLVLSRAYRQSSTYRREAFEVDPDNRLLWRANKRRLPAEAIRDAMLAAAGELDTRRPVGSLVGREIGDRPVALLGLDSKLPPDLDGALHRSVYLPVLRDRLPDVFELFDFAEPSLVTGERETTNVPLQALYLMNSPFVQARAAALAARVTREVEPEARAARAFELCLGRPPDAAEAKFAREFLASAPEASADDGPKFLAAYCQALLAAAEFRNLD